MGIGSTVFICIYNIYYTDILHGSVICMGGATWVFAKV